MFKIKSRIVQDGSQRLFTCQHTSPPLFCWHTLLPLLCWHTLQFALLAAQKDATSVTLHPFRQTIWWPTCVRSEVQIQVQDGSQRLFTCRHTSPPFCAPIALLSAYARGTDFWRALKFWGWFNLQSKDLKLNQQPREVPPFKGHLHVCTLRPLLCTNHTAICTRRRLCRLKILTLKSCSLRTLNSISNNHTAFNVVISDF